MTQKNSTKITIMSDLSLHWTFKLLGWFDREKRSMPWRGVTDPYKILISEIMLQQTRVEQAIPFYQNFIEVFPCLEDLALAPTEKVLEAWNGLGYYRRGKLLQQCAQVILQNYQGAYPQSFEEWLSLPGIGRYTAGALLSIAFNKPYPAVDGNVARVMSRFMGLYEDIAKDASKKSIEDLLFPVYPIDRCGDFAQALMELGACVCFPKRPLCKECPLADECIANIQHLQELLPIKQKKSPPSKEIWAVFIIREFGKIMLVARNNETLLSDFQGLPMVKASQMKSMEKAFLKKYQESIRIKQLIGEMRYVFSHRIWLMKIFEAEKKQVVLALHENSDRKDIDYPVMTEYSDITKISIAKPFLKVLEILEVKF
jgi:A/G-specific adenine glycosylase